MLVCSPSHKQYGFGLVNAGAAVQAARSTSRQLLPANVQPAVVTTEAIPAIVINLALGGMSSLYLIYRSAGYTGQ